MKTLTILTTALLLAGSAVQADQLHLRYEWSATTDGSYAGIPPENLRVNADGTATVLTNGPRGFFRLLFNGDGPGGGGTVPVMPFSALPETTRFAVRELLSATAADRSTEGNDWIGARLPAFVTPVTSAWNDTGVPDMAEIKIIGPCDAPPPPGSLFQNEDGARTSPDRGFILVGISRKSPPIVGYNTRGITPTESLLRHCDGGKVRTIIRFGPMFLGALDSDGNLLANRGLLPAIYPDQAYRDRSAPVSRTWNSEVANNPRMPEKPAAALPRTFANFGQLLTAYRTTPFLNERRLNTERLIEFDWLSLEGRAPTLNVKVGETVRFLPGDTYTRYWLDDEDTPRPAEIVLGGAGGGLEITGGTVPGAYRLRLEGRSVGDPCVHPEPFLLVVSPPGAAPRGGNAPEWKTTSTLWEAGTEAKQPRFNQRSDLNEWCDAVGCGPVMLALMIAWAEQNQNVPGAYWNRTTSSVTTRRASVRNIDCPTRYVTDDPAGTMFAWYEWLHDECDVACWANGAGSSMPWDVGNTLESYFGESTSQLYLPLILGDPGTSYAGGSWHWENDGWGDDWDEAGIRVANAIKAGRPGGVYYMEHWHYAMAWRYRKTKYELKSGPYVIQTKIARHFRVNTGWGDGDEKDAVWNAYDIDGCYLLNMFQRRLPPP